MGDLGMLRWMVLALALACCGCGQDPVRVDLETYQREILDHVIREEAASSKELSSAMSDVTGGRMDARAARKVYADRLGERYRALALRLIAYRPATPELAQLNARLAGQYEQIAQELDRAAAHLAKGEWSGFSEAHARIASSGFESIRPQLAALGAAHGLDAK